MENMHLLKFSIEAYKALQPRTEEHGCIAQVPADPIRRYGPSTVGVEGVTMGYKCHDITAPLRNTNPSAVVGR